MINDSCNIIFLKYILKQISTGKRNASFGGKEGKYRFYTCSSSFLYCNEYSYEDEAILVTGNGDVGNVFYASGKYDVYQRTYILFFNKLIGNAYAALKKNKSKFISIANGSVLKFLKINDFNNIKVSSNLEINKYNYLIMKLEFIYEKILEINKKIINKLINILIN